MKVPQTYVPARAVAPEDISKCATFGSHDLREPEILAWLPLNEPVQLIEPVTMRFFEGGSVTLEGVVTLRRRGTPSSFGEVEV